MTLLADSDLSMLYETKIFLLNNFEMEYMDEISFVIEIKNFETENEDY